MNRRIIIIIDSNRLEVRYALVFFVKRSCIFEQGCRDETARVFVEIVGERRDPISIERFERVQQNEQDFLVMSWTR